MNLFQPFLSETGCKGNRFFLFCKFFKHIFIFFRKQQVVTIKIILPQPYTICTMLTISDAEKYTMMQKMLKFAITIIYNGYARI